MEKYELFYSECFMFSSIDKSSKDQFITSRSRICFIEQHSRYNNFDTKDERSFRYLSILVCFIFVRTLIIDSHKQNGHDSIVAAQRITTNSDTHIIPIEKPSTPTGTSITTKLMNQMKNLSVAPTTSNAILTSAIQSPASYLNDYEITGATTPSPKKPAATIAAFPPRHSVTSENHGRDTPTSTISNEGGIRFGTTPGPQITPSV